jgi:hypothetical protein
MKALFVLTAFGSLAWFAFSPVYYFIMGPKVAKLSMHLWMSSGDTETECFSFASDWNRAFPTSGAYCEGVPRWKHWSNFVRNVAYQIEVYRSVK